MNDNEFRTLIFSRDRARDPFIRAMAHAAAMLDNGEHVLVTVGPALEPISVKQRGFFHGVVLAQISEQVRTPDGTRYVVAIWKEYYRKRFLPDTWEMQRLPGQKKATPQRVRHSSEGLGVKGYSEYIDRVIADATTEWAVAFEFQGDEREAVRYRAPERKPKQPEAEPA